MKYKFTLIFLLSSLSYSFSEENNNFLWLSGDLGLGILSNSETSGIHKLEVEGNSFYTNLAIAYNLSPNFGIGFEHSRHSASNPDISQDGEVLTSNSKPSQSNTLAGPFIRINSDHLFYATFGLGLGSLLKKTSRSSDSFDDGTGINIRIGRDFAKPGDILSWGLAIGYQNLNVDYTDYSDKISMSASNLSMSLNANIHIGTSKDTNHPDNSGTGLFSN